MCGHGSSSATTSSTSAPTQAVQDMYKYIMEQGKALQQKPYEAYTGEMVPELNAIQQSGINQAQQFSTAAQPYYQRSGQMTQDVYSGYNPQNYSSGVQSYMNPYMQNAMSATAAQMNNINQQEQNKLTGNAISSGAFGGDRGKIAQSALMGQQNLALGNVLANMANTGYNSAATNYLSGLQQQGGLANQYGNLGNAVQNAGMSGAQGLMTAGAVPYAVQQAQDAAKYQQSSQGQAYPFQTLGLLANMASGLGAGQGGISSTTAPGPNSMNSILGLGTAFLNMSDERTKENAEPIGKTFDGQNIYKFNYKGDPKTNIGLMAQEVEQHNPSAVHKTDGGLRMVDYDSATSHAADRGHFSGGGSSMGGLVSSGMDRQPFAKGGYGLVPYADDPLYAFMSERLSTPMVAYIPQIDIKGGGVSIPDAPKTYTDKPYDTEGLTGFGKAVKGKYGSLFGINANDPSYISGAGGYSGMGPFTSVGYADGGLVPRSHHAGGDTPPRDKEVPADDYSLGGLGSSIAKGVGSLFSTDTQPGLIGNIFNAGKPLDEDTRLGIMAAGLGMAASPSPFVGQAIGQGGLTGLNTYANRKKAIAEQALKSREVGVQEAGIPIRRDEVENMILQTKIKQFENWRALYRPVPDESGRVGSYVDPNGQEIPPEDFVKRQIIFMQNVGLPIDAYLGTQSRASGGRAGYASIGSVDENQQKPIVLAQDNTVKNPTETQSFEAEKDLSPELKQMLQMQKDVERMNKAAPHMVYAPDVQARTYEQIRQMKEQLQALQGREYETPTGVKYRWQYGATQKPNEAPKPLTDQSPRAQIDPDTGAIKTVPIDIGYPETKGFPASVLPKHAVKVGADPIYSKAVEQNAPIENEFLEQSQGTQEAITTLAKFSAAAKAIQTGALTGDRTHIAAILQSLGFDSVATAVAGAASPAEAQILAKSAIDGAVAKVTSAFAKPTQSEFHLIETKASPNLDNQPEANFSLSKTQLGAAMWQDKLRRDWLEAKSQGAQNFLAYQALWKRQNNRQIFEDSAERLLGNYAGQELPSADKIVSGGVYVVPPVKKGENLTGLKYYLYKNGFTAGDVITIPRATHYKDKDGKMKIDFDEPNKVPDNQIYQHMLSQPGFGFGG